MEYTYIISEIKNQAGIIALNHPAKHNALSKTMIEEIIDALSYFKTMSLRAVILRAAKGSAVFSSGHDIHELAANEDPLTYTDPLRKLVRVIQQHNAPVIAMIEGGVWGGAFEMAMSCDIVIAEKHSTFAITPAKLGLPYDIAGVKNIIKVAGQHLLKEMFFTAQPIDAQKAYNVGLVNYIIDSEEIEQFTMNMAAVIVANAPLSVMVIKEEIRVLESGENLTTEEYERIQSLREKVYKSNDYSEGIRAFMEKRKAVFTGS